MAIKDFMQPGYGPRLACEIVSVDPESRRIEAALKDDTIVQVAVFDTPGFFVWPYPRERWTIQKCNGIWMLDRRLGESDEFQINSLNPGEGKINADTIKTPTGKSVIIVDDKQASDGQTLQYVDNQWAVTDSPSEIHLQANAPIEFDSTSKTISVTIGAEEDTVAAGNDVRIVGAEQVSNKGQSNGYAGLDENAKVDIENVPTGTTENTVALGNHTHPFLEILTELPKNPVLDQEVLYVANNNADRTIWKLKWSGDDWHYIGGSPVALVQDSPTNYRAVDIPLNTWYSEWGNATDGYSQLIKYKFPLAGAYKITYSANLQAEDSLSTNSLASFAIGLTSNPNNLLANLDADSIAYSYTDLGYSPVIQVSRSHIVNIYQSTPDDFRTIYLAANLYNAANWKNNHRTRISYQYLEIIPVGTLLNW